jgi:hypothetical protein
MKLDSSELLSMCAIKPWNRIRSYLTTGNETTHSRSARTAFPVPTVQSAWPGNAAQTFVSVPQHFIWSTKLFRVSRHSISYEVRSFSVYQDTTFHMKYETFPCIKTQHFIWSTKLLRVSRHRISYEVRSFPCIKTAFHMKYEAFPCIKTQHFIWSTKFSVYQEAAV